MKKDWHRGFGVLFAQNPAGFGSYCNLVFKNRGGNALVDMDDNAIGSFEWKENKDCIQPKQ